MMTSKMLCAMAVLGAQTWTHGVMPQFFDDPCDGELRVTETPKRKKSWPAVVHPDAKPLRDRKRVLARKAR
jgi:hypothetical protein